MTASCVQKPLWNAYICPNSYVGVRIFTYDGTNLAGAVLQRDDGASRVLGSEPGAGDDMHFAVIEDRPHVLNLPVAAPKRLTFQRVEKAGKAARVAISYPTSGFTMTLWGTNVAKATSLSELGSGGTKYFYDAATKLLHMRLVSTDGGWKEFEINRP